MLIKLYDKVISASRYSYDGCKYLLYNEFAARVEVYAYFWMMVALILLKSPVVNLGIMTILFLILIALEALNTAIEVIIDRVSPEISPAGKRAKDLGSFAVFCAIIANAIFFFNAVSQTERASQLMSRLLAVFN